MNAPTLALLAIAALAAAYAWPVRRWFGRWGADASDLARVMPGDDFVDNPTYRTTLAVTVAAAPRHIWPWLMQMGYRRGGLYSYDWLDRLFGYLDRPSATTILPEHQQLSVGEVIPMGRAGGFPVVGIEPMRYLVLGGRSDGFAWVWQFGVVPLDDGRTRLVSRNLVHAPASLGTWCFLRIIEPAAFLMTRRMLLGIRDRAERLARVVLITKAA
jgi:hypothetical protein